MELSAGRPRVVGDFNFNFHFHFNVSFTEEQQRSGTVEYNYRDSGVSSRKSIPRGA
jgi:predicted dithiol-disulfide oxidoreductase (DUF899 family)